MKKQTSTLAAPALGASLLWRVVSQAIVLVTFIVVVLTTLSFVVSRIMLERSVRAHLLAVASIAEDTLERSLHTNRERASLVSSHADVRALLAGNNNRAAFGRLLVLLQRDEPSLRSIELFNAEGQHIALAGESIGLPMEARRVPFHRQVIGATGWTFYDVFTPVWQADGALDGYVALRYDTSSLISPLINAAPSLGESAQALLVVESNNEIHLLHPAMEQDDSYIVSLGSTEAAQGIAFVAALDGREGVTRDNDERGRDAFIAYRYMPTLGWGLVFEVERAEALADVRRLALAHGGMGFMLLLLAGVLAFLLARQVTEPLRTLTANMRAMKPGHWHAVRSVHSGDEVEMLDIVLVDMARRLREVYEHQEEEIESRTAELKRQYALDGVILEQIGYGVITVDTKGVITAGNPAATALLNVERDMLIGENVIHAFQLCGHRGDLLLGTHPVIECLQTRKAVHFPVHTHVSVRRNDDTMIPISFAVSPLISERTEFGAIIVFQDVSEERRLDYLKSEFITLASHQLRTPLSALRWYIELLGEERSGLTKEQQSYLKEMEMSSARMVALLASLLHAAHLEGDQLELEISKANIGELLKELEEDSKITMHEAGVKCVQDIPSKAISIDTDPTLIRIALQNIINNAVKYSAPHGGKTISISLKESKSHIQIDVQDEGMGIPKTEQSRVFQKFFRAKNVRKKDTDGNGLGLYITRTIVERLGGTISFTSIENKGTTFTLTFPLKLEREK